MPDAEVARDPTRKLSYVSCVGWYTSIKMGVRFPFESLTEHDAMLLLDVDPEVQGFHAQPETFRWSQDGRARCYTPDLGIEFVDERREYREVKPDGRRRDDPSLDGRLPGIVRECAQRGARFNFWTKSNISRQPRLSNAKRLRSGIEYLNAESVARVREAVAKVGLPATLGRLVVAAGSELRLEGAILGLAALGYLSVSVEERLGPSTLVSEGWRN